MSKVELTPAGNPILFERSEIKATLMQASYGQREKGSKEQLSDDLKSEYTDEIYDIFVLAVDRVVPGFYSIMEQVNNLWKSDWNEISFYMPDGVKVTCKPTDSKWKNFTLFGELKIEAKVSGVSKEEKALILYVTIIHACDAYLARMVIMDADFDVLTIHDGYKTLANNTRKTRELYNMHLADIAQNDLLANILSQITGEIFQPITGDLNPEDILDSKYSLS